MVSAGPSTTSGGASLAGTACLNHVRFPEFETENARLKKLLAAQVPKNHDHEESASKEVVTASARRMLVRELMGKGLIERRALFLARMIASAFRHVSRSDRIVALREEIVSLAHHLRRYGVAMIYLKVRQSRWAANDKRVEGLYREVALQGRRRKGKKLAPGQRQPLLRPPGAEVYDYRGRCDARVGTSRSGTGDFPTRGREWTGNGGLRDSCLNEHWCVHLFQARTVI